MFRVVLSLFIATSLGLSTVSLARKGKHGHKRFHKMVEQLKLTEDQQKKLEEAHKGHKESMKKAHDDVRSKREAMHAALGDTTKTEDDLRKMHAEVIAAQKVVMETKFEKMMGLRALLTDEQKKKLPELHKMGGKKGKKKK